jgi:hypothetical protein
MFFFAVSAFVGLDDGPFLRRKKILLKASLDTENV